MNYFCRAIVLVTLTTAAVQARSFSLNLSYAGGYLPTVTDDHGSVTSLFVPPVPVSSTSSAANVLANRLISRFGATVTRGSSISGTMDVDAYKAKFLPDSNFNSFGADFVGRLNSTEDLTNTRWIIDKQLFYNGAAVDDDVFCMTSIFGMNPPFYYADIDEHLYRNGTNSFGPYSYRLSWTNIFGTFLTSDPHTEGAMMYAFLVTANGQNNYTIRDGVQFGQTTTVVPEPTAMFGLAIGICAFVRKQRKGKPTSKAGS